MSPSHSGIENVMANKVTAALKPTDAPWSDDQDANKCHRQNVFCCLSTDNLTITISKSFFELVADEMLQHSVPLFEHL